MKKFIISFGGVIKEEEIAKNRHYISYGLVRDYSAEVKRLFKSSEKYGFDGFLEYDENWLKNSPYWLTDARKVLEEPSFGWAFKSISVLDALSMIDEGDFVLWVDSNDMLVNDPQPLFDFAKENGMYLHDHYPVHYPLYQFTHKDTFIHMKCDEARYWGAIQIQVNIMAFCKTQKVLDFVKEWVLYSTSYETMIQNIYPNHPEFIDHRHEQSIISILREKYNINYTRGYPYRIAAEVMGINVTK